MVRGGIPQPIEYMCFILGNYHAIHVFCAFFLVSPSFFKFQPELI
jgi:hypothetical protein